MRVRALLGRRDVRLLVVASALSGLGDWALLIVFAVWVKDVTGSDGLAGLTAFAVVVPSATLAPFTGWLADRVRRRTLLIAVNAGSAFVVLPLLLVDGVERIWIVYAVAFGYGISHLTVTAATAGLVKTLLPDELIADGNGLLQTLREGLRLLGPLIGAGVYAAYGPAVVAVADALTFVVAAVLVASLRVREPVPARGTRVRSELVDGVRHLARSPAVRRVTLTLAVAFAVVGFTESALFAVVEAVGRPPSFVGVTSTVQGAGAIAGGVFAAPLIRRLGEQAAVAAGLALFAIGLVLIVVPTLGTLLAGMAVAGAGIPWAIVGFSTLLQRRTPWYLIGRVSAACEVAISVPQTLSIVTGAVLIGVVGHTALLSAMVAVFLGCGLWLVVRPDRAEPAAGSAVPVERSERPVEPLVSVPAGGGRQAAR